MSDSRRNARGSLGWTMAAAGAVVGFLLAAGTFSWSLLEREGETPPVVNEAPGRSPGTTNALEKLTAPERRTIEVFQNTSKSVVNISTSKRVHNLFRRTALQVPRGQGTGFIWDKQGHVVTNYHVILNADYATVTLWDNSKYQATLVGPYPDKDLAVLKIDAPSELLSPVTVGSSRDLLVGQSVLAIGNPFGLDQTLTTGIVSALDREIQAINGEHIAHVIQTDAAINPGNSGGPLLDSAGKVIGVNTMIVSPDNSSAGIGFAVPVDTVKLIVPQLIKHGDVRRPFHPVLGVEIDPEVLKRHALIQIRDVRPASGAKRAGLESGDVIYRINGAEVRRLKDLQYQLERHHPGDHVKVTYLRGRKLYEASVQLDEPVDQ